MNAKFDIPGDIASKSRSITKPGLYAILPASDRVFSTLPQFNRGVSAKVMAAPNMGARFVEHELFTKPNGGTDGVIQEDLEQFLFVLEGNLTFELEGKKHQMIKGGYCWLPPKSAFAFKNTGESLCRMLWIRRKFELIDKWGIPDPIIANEQDMAAEPVDTYTEKHLTPYYENTAFDMGINLQFFNPGVYFDMIESHIMEHGLYMVEGRGIYYLNRDFIEVQKDDFIYMAPFCPQSFYATGWDGSQYLLYKDVNRDYSDGL